MPTAPAAPALFETTTGCLSARSSAGGSARAVRSAMPPGGNGTTMVIGRVGYGSWAPAGATSGVAASDATASRMAENARIIQASMA